MNNSIKNLLTVEDILYWVEKKFHTANIWYGHGTDNAWDEAVQLVLTLLNLYPNFSKNILSIPKNILSIPLTFLEKKCIVQYTMRRINERIPVAYLTNRTWFCNHEFYVDERVIIPRSPISELISNHLPTLVDHIPYRILDMCTGSGCIAISCAYVFPKAKIDLVDISTDALDVAKYNIELHNLNKRTTLIHSNLFCNIPKNQYDLIISNPPYVDEKTMSNLPYEYYYEPKLSLLSGKDGLELIRRILECSADYLNENGILICEVGNNMTHLIKEYPDVPFLWFEFTNGGEGIFMLTKFQLTNIH